MRVTHYKTSWNTQTKTGSFRLHFNNGQWTQWLRYDNIQEYQVILMLLQNERPVYFHSENGTNFIYTDIEDTGLQD